MAAQWKHPDSVDLICKFRVIGHAKNSITFESGAPFNFLPTPGPGHVGDGYTTLSGYMQGEGPVLKARHYEEWAEQLENCLEMLHQRADILRNNGKKSLKLNNRFEILKKD